MFTPNQISYPLQSPKVAAMRQFIQMHQYHPKSPEIKSTIQPYGNDLFQLDNLVRQFSDQVSLNWNKPAGTDFNGSTSGCTMSIQASPTLFPRRHYTETSLPLQHAPSSPATPWEIQKTSLNAMLQKISSDGCKFVPHTIPAQKDTK